MAKKRVKKRTHVGAPGVKPPPGTAPKKPGSRSPKSMVIRIGASDVGPSISQLVKDVRTMMEPETASRLKERRNNKLRDYTTMAGPLGVTHLLLFTRSSNGNVNLRLAVTPRGPTLHFRVEKYSLCKDVQNSQKRPRGGAADLHTAAPLLVMNNFVSKEDENGTNGAEKKIPKHLETLTTSTFQSMFPSINPTSTSLKGIKRIMLLDRTSEPQDGDEDAAPYVLNLRHYAIETRTAKSVPKALRRLDAAEKLSHTNAKRKRGGLPNLSKFDDVADYLLDPHAAEGFTSGSDSEPETDAEVEVMAPHAQKVQKRNSKPSKPSERFQDRQEQKSNVQKKGIKLHELGPRLRLRLTKVEEGLCTGKVMWHQYIHKSDQEIKQMDKAHEEKRQEKERRRAEQKANVERKKKESGANGKEGDGELSDEEMLSDDDDVWEGAEDEDVDGVVEEGSEDEDEEMG